MPIYNTKIQVPWREILAYQHHVLRRSIRDYQRGDSTPDFQLHYLERLKESYQNYHLLRRFLCYTTPTQLEKQAEKYLKL